MTEPRRLGRFTFNTRALPSVANAVFTSCHALKRFDSRFAGKMEYLAECAEFDPVPDGVTPPTYRPLVTRDADNALTVRWLRQGGRHAG